MGGKKNSKADADRTPLQDTVGEGMRVETIPGGFSAVRRRAGVTSVATIVMRFRMRAKPR